MFSRRLILKGLSATMLTAASGGTLLATPASSASDPIVLRAMPGTAPLAPSLTGASGTEIWGYNGQVPGPTIRCRRGDKLHVRLINGLDQPTSIHWHGIRIANAMDGVPGLTQEPVKPGESHDYEFVAPDAGTYWYHTHSRAWEQMARGLYGLLIVEDDQDQHFDRDIPLALDDWALEADGQLASESLGSLHEWAHGGRLGNWLTTNGRGRQVLGVRSGERIRLRLANTANARILDLAVEGADASLIALDGHPVSPMPLSGKSLSLSPGQRTDLLLDVRGKPGDKIEIVEVSGEQAQVAATFAIEPEPKSNGRAGQPFSALTHTMDHGKFDVSSAEPVELKMSGGAMGRMDRAIVNGLERGWRELVELKRVWAFNGVAGDLDRPLLQAKLGQTVVINIVNDTSWPHAMHLHGHHFKVVARRRQSIANAPWRDTELVEPDETVAIAFLADNPGKWLLHCHMLGHQVSGMTTWFDVIA